ncbi:hypothetical protein [Micromonospora narathiwatensis]|uniref:Uncharacterized protein n=1 Tax=Micromonospora narathiwatensis TaxID=299146 RepID=A0A1A8ZSB1_9ACTN|nr:hypothetical protein [Micromonospora narathiwatensis]SBT46714.1 hypothetical protein GA0070621_2695 [Micromonospora narathiwatensis]
MSAPSIAPAPRPFPERPAAPPGPSTVSSAVTAALHDLLGVELTATVRPTGDLVPVDWPAAAVPAASAGRRRQPDGASTARATGDGLTLEVTGAGRLACDVAAVRPRPLGDWERLLAEHAALAREAMGLAGERHDTAACRTDAVLRCLRALRLPTSVPLVIAPPRRPGWLVYVSGTLRVATLVVRRRSELPPVTLAFLTDG